MQPAPRQRDAERSRGAILDAAEQLFARHGYTATSMHEIAIAAGLARATPGYFFGSKDALYQAVLHRVHRQRSVALSEACAPLYRWAREPDAGQEALRAAIASGVSGYTAFLVQRPEFARLIEWESLADARRLPVDPSPGFLDAFRAVHRVRAERGLRDFDVATVVVAVLSLCFLPVAHASTFKAGGGIDTLAPQFRARYQAQIADSVLGMLLP
jgi:TetR/AcrR family transcriptional regulator